MNPKGLRFILGLLRQTLSLPLFVYITLSYVPWTAISSWPLKLAVCLAAMLTVKVISAISQKLEMKRLGAQPVPLVKSKWPLAIDILLSILEEEKSGYLAHHITGWAEQYGRTFGGKVLADYVVRVQP